MQINRFQCEGLNAFLNYDLRLFSDVSFLHGINGSGKTSILRAIASLLTPDPIWLFNSTFGKISVDLEYYAQNFKITATAALNTVSVSIEGAIELVDSFAVDELGPILKIFGRGIFLPRFDSRATRVLQQGPGAHRTVQDI
jgi:hypothetical protein